MNTRLNVRSMVLPLGIVAAVMIGMAQGPRNVADEWTALWSGMSSEDPCVYSEYLNTCPNEPGETGCTTTYNKYEEWGYLTVLTIKELLFGECDDRAWDFTHTPPILVIDGPCDDGTGKDIADDTDCQESC